MVDYFFPCYLAGGRERERSRGIQIEIYRYIVSNDIHRRRVQSTRGPTDYMSTRESRVRTVRFDISVGPVIIRNNKLTADRRFSPWESPYWIAR